MRAPLILAAVGMFLWIITGTVLWLGEHGNPYAAFTHFWTALQSDWMLLVVATDMLMFTVAAFVWVAIDLHAHRAPATRILGWLVPMLFLGSAVLFLYLARRTAVSTRTAVVL